MKLILLLLIVCTKCFCVHELEYFCSFQNGPVLLNISVLQKKPLSYGSPSAIILIERHYLSSKRPDPTLRTYMDALIQDSPDKITYIEDLGSSYVSISKKPTSSPTELEEWYPGSILLKRSEPAHYKHIRRSLSFDIQGKLQCYPQNPSN